MEIIKKNPIKQNQKKNKNEEGKKLRKVKIIKSVGERETARMSPPISSPEGPDSLSVCVLAEMRNLKG